MPSLPTPAASKAQVEPVSNGTLVAWGIASYSPSVTQTVALDNNAGTSTNKASVAHAAYTAELTWVADAQLRVAKDKKLTVDAVSKISIALKGLNGKNNVMSQQNVTLSDAAAFGFASMMQNDITKEKIPEPVLKLLKKLVPTLKTNPTEVDLQAGAVTAAVGSLSGLSGLASFAAYDATTGKAAQVWYEYPR
jgi:hypothetical protein